MYLRRRLASGLLVLCAALHGSCGQGEEDASALGSEIGSSTQPIVYDNDDRQEVYEHPNAKLRQLARGSVVALVQKENLLRTDGGRVELVAPPLGEAYELCSGEAFSNQPTAGWCTGVVIDDDLVLTAGHCLTETLRCENYQIVFDYLYDGPEEMAQVSAADIYGCRRVVTQILTPEGDGTLLDYTIIQLDRPVLPPRAPVEIRRGLAVLNEPMAVIGAPNGIPLKIDSGGQVLDVRAGTKDYFVLDSDTFEGSSGSPIFDRDYALLGILVRGGEDYVVSGSGCRRVNVAHPDTLSPANLEHATYVRRAVDALCTTGYPSQRLCRRGPSCGDGFCTDDEQDGSCPSDCVEASACVAPPCAKSPSTPPELVIPDGGLSEETLAPLPRPSCSVGQARSSRRASPTGLPLVLALGVFANRRIKRRRTDTRPS